MIRLARGKFGLICKAVRLTNMYQSETSSIVVTVEPSFLAHESDPQSRRYFWSYRVTIQNNSNQKVQLLTRYWHITDDNGQVQEVRGEGVVGQTPILAPGEAFEYASGCPLATPSGIMRGSYKMRRSDGTLFDIDIPAFSLDIPNRPKVLN